MYLGIPTQKSCACAWVAAASAIIDVGEAYNVVVDVTDPVTHDDKDNEVITLVDKFLKLHDANPIITVSNTIFPQSLYDAHGAPAFYGIEHRDYDKLTETKRWGRYFERMTRHQKADGTTYNPLQDEILRRESGAPYVRLSDEVLAMAKDLGITDWFISISYAEDLVIASAIAVGE